MCLVYEYNRLNDEIAKLELLKESIAKQVIANCEANGLDKYMSEDGIHYLKYTKAAEPKWHDPEPAKATKYLEGYMDNGRKASVRFY